MAESKNLKLGSPPRLIAWEITRSCTLNCRHCRAAARYGPYPNEFTTDECFKVLDNIASFARPIMILTGGEPMLRDDIFEIATYGSRLGLRMTMAPCGFLFDNESVQKMKAAGIERISLSLDGATARTHDTFRRIEGAFDAVVRAMRCAREKDLDFQINTTVTKHNLKELDHILQLAIESGAVAFHPFLLVPTGRGKELAGEEISPTEYESVLNWIYDQRKKVPIQFKPTCAPHYYRIFRQREKEQGRRMTPQTHGLDAMTKGCMGGQSFAFISHTGRVQICGFLETECGDVRKENYDFRKIWETSPIFEQMRNLDGYHGRCGYCEYRKVCGGCRARAFAATGDYLDEEPYCIYEPKMGAKESPCKGRLIGVRSK
ncbi:MAG: heme b synthase [bacterium]